MRIIAGKHKGRSILSPSGEQVKPTTSKNREAIFSILSSGTFMKNGASVLTNAVVMDLFCGSGILAFEALSRGAQTAILVDIDQKNIEIAKTNAAKLGETNNIHLLRSDARFLPKSRLRCDVVFMDPPYNSNLINASLNSLKQQEWLKPNAIIILELAKKEDIQIPAEFTILDERRYSKTKILFLEAI